VHSSRAAIALAERFPGVYAAVGIHPEAVREAGLADLKTIRELAVHPRVVAIGEIGLDYYWDKESADTQLLFLERQMEMAGDLNLPVSIHDRDAHRDILGIIGKYTAQHVRGVLHAFSGDAAMAQTAIDLGYTISFAGPITFLNAHQAPGLVQLVPMDKVLIETDSPYLTPHPLRGRRNEPANVGLVAERIAALTGRGVDKVAETTTHSARALFDF
jgi:TatD DNase family protein